MTIGGSKESQNATEAGALNMASQQFNKVRVKAQDPYEKQFSDVFDTQKGVTLANVNRVWAKTLLANINVAAMGDTYGSAQANTHAQELFDAASRMSDRLTGQLENTSVMSPLFDEMSGRNVISMTGVHAGVKAVDLKDWSTSLVDRQIESNIQLSSDQMPLGFDYKKLKTTQVQGADRLQGYAPISVNGKNICFVPFKNNERTQLISAKVFDENTLKAKPLPEWKTPVPNAFKTYGQADGSKYKGIACVLANPQRTFSMNMPAGFVRISLLRNEADCIVGPNMPKSVSYDYDTAVHFVESTEDSLSWPGPKVGINDTDELANIYLGTEFGDKCTLKDAIFNRKINGDVLQALLQRVKEIKPDCTAAQLINLLSGTRAETGDFIIFLDSSAPDAKNAKLVVAPVSMVKGINPAINTNGLADGYLRTLHTDPLDLLTDYHVFPPLTGAIALTVGGWAPALVGQAEEATLKWAPGSGFDGCLGTLTVFHHTIAKVKGVVHKPPVG
jgi:hypothetical protein